MPKRQIKGFFSCISVKEPVMAISVPISDTAKKERDRLTLNSTLSEEERKILEEINEKILIIERIKLKTPQQEYLSKLMYSIKEFATKGKYLDAIESLKQMITIYVVESKKIDWNQYQFMSPASLVVPPDSTQNFENSDGNSLLTHLTQK